MYRTITTRDKNFFELTHKIASTSLCHYRVGAIITNGARVLAVGVNVLKSHPIITQKYQEHCISIHAELSALLKAQTNIVGATMYVARDGGKISKPCKACRSLITLAGIRYIVYSTKEGLVKEHV